MYYSSNNFKNDIIAKSSFISPVVVIGADTAPTFIDNSNAYFEERHCFGLDIFDINNFINSDNFDFDDDIRVSDVCYPFLAKFPSLSTKINYFDKKLQTNTLSIQFNNTVHNGKTFKSIYSQKNILIILHQYIISDLMD